MKQPRRIIKPSLSPDRMRELAQRPWTDTEVERALERLDDTGMWLLSTFGTAMGAAFEHGEWVVRASGLTIPARQLTEHFHLDQAHAQVLRRCRSALCCESILIAAGSESVDERRVRDMAAKLAPVDPELFCSLSAGEHAMLDARQKLVDDGMLGFVRSAHFRDRVMLTDAGRRRMNMVVYPSWARLSRMRFDDQQAYGESDD